MTASADDQAAILQIIIEWSAAARRRDYEGVLKHHSPDILMFDVPPPFQSQGIAAHRETWETFFSWMADPPTFEFSDVRITAGQDVAFATAHGHCRGPDAGGRPIDLEFRLTMGLRKQAGQWLIEHEHHSVPAD